MRKPIGLFFVFFIEFSIIIHDNQGVTEDIDENNHKTDFDLN